MRFDARTTKSLILTALVLGPLMAAGQTLTITNGIQTYTALTNTTVNMTGRSELHITGTNSPISGCLINLNSSDAWFFMDNIQPASVVSSYLGQITVNGAAAVVDNNVRVVEYAMGAVVIPQSPTYLPLQVFTGSQFTGSSMQLGLYTYYNSANWGAMNNTISSFKLKRGYMATFAQQADGSGISRVYVAQDGDIEVGALPSGLNDALGFIRVFPWRWTGKKGWSGAVQPLVNPFWSYDWDNVATSTRNAEYVPMRHDANWDAYANINNKQDSTHALGFNEPDSPSQANMTVAQAIAAWPNLMTSGLRLGSPAVTDGGLDWLYSFIDTADALNYRVDYVTVHFYKCGWTATQLHDWLWGIHVRTHRPVWVTEFNNGANWTTCAVPTLAQNAQVIGDFITMMDSAPFVERYAIYNWVGDTRAMVDTNNALTPAGVVYLNEVSPNAYLQEFPAGVGSDANYLFDGDARDRTGSGNDAMLVGAPSFTTGQSGQAIQLDGVHDCVQMPANVGDSTNFTFAAWVNWNGGANWQRIFDLGADTSQYLFLSPSSGASTLRFAITTSGYSAEQHLEGSPLTPGVWTHVAVTISGTTGKLFVNGAPVATNNSMTVNPAVVMTKYNYLGKSQFSADPLFAGQLDDVFFAGYALTDAQVAALPATLPPQFASDPILKADAYWNKSYSGSIAGDATNPGGGTLTFSKVDGPAWLAVAADGGLSGAPGVADLGTNTFTVRVVNSGGVDAITRLTIAVKSLTPQPANPGFETPVTATYIYNPGGGSWTFSGAPGNGSGVTLNNSGFTAGNAAAPEGVQVAFLQANSTISQAISGFVPGTNYTVSFMASQRQNKGGGQSGETFNVQIDGVTIGSFTPSQAVSSYLPYSTNFTATATTHTLAFVGTDLNGGDNTVFLDNVAIFLTSALPATPIGVTATPANGQISLSWTATPGATGYKVKRATASGGPYTTIASPATASYIDAGLVNYATLYYVVSATNSLGESANSAEVSATPAVMPGNFGFETPVTATYIYNPSGGSWTFSGAAGNGSGVTANNSPFTAGNAVAPQGVQVAFVQVNGTISQALSGFVPGSTYTVKFMASQRQNKSGGQAGQTFNLKVDNTVIGSIQPSQSVVSYVEFTNNFFATAATHTLAFVGTDAHGGDNTVFLDNVRITVPPPQVAPANLAATAGDGQVALNWGATAGATGYNVKRATVGGGPYPTVATVVTATNYLDPDVLNGTTYYYVVSAVNASGESGVSAQVSAHPVSSAPIQVDYALNANQLEIAWPPDHTGWQVQVQTNSSSTGLGTNWITLPETMGTNRYSVPIDSGSGSVFYRLFHP
jgi:fibronectin type 3 domain-containing protein